MKKSVLLIILSVFITNSLLSQNLEVNKVDEFTGNTVKRTSWEKLISSMKFISFFRASRINEATYLDIKCMINASVFSIDEGDE
ncbi:MAG: hypothetical protein ACOCUL_01275, partial [Bacteroidota bacterium]